MQHHKQLFTTICTKGMTLILPKGKGKSSQPNTFNVNQRKITSKLHGHDAFMSALLALMLYLWASQIYLQKYNLNKFWC